ncbi:MAG: hypothetical protein LBB22_02935 [Treponema sp.]|nr:hypothetical protein [Treponema sp.]
MNNRGTIYAGSIFSSGLNPPEAGHGSASLPAVRCPISANPPPPPRNEFF